SSVTLTAQFDCMVVDTDATRAAMSGQITSPTDSPFFGQQVTLVLAPNLAGTSPSSDAFLWGVYKPKTLNLTPTDFDFCQGPPDPAVCDTSENCPTPTCLFDGTVVNDQSVPSYASTWTASDYELCPYPPDELLGGTVPTDPHNYVCFTGSPDPN